ncbi:MAG: YniB family protein [Mucilaginibacter sp.]
MKYKDARKKSIHKRLLGLALSTAAIISTAVSLLKMIYFRLDDGSQLGGIISRPFKVIVSWVYENTQFFSFFWEKSPIPNQLKPLQVENAYFIGIYLMVFVGFAFYSSGAKLTNRLNEINEKIENQLIEESIKGMRARSREEIESSTEIPSSSIFSQFHQLYLAPVVTGIIVAVILKLAGV